MVPLVFPVRAVAKGVTHLETKGTPTLDKDLSEIGTFSRVHSGQAGGGPPPRCVWEEEEGVCQSRLADCVGTETHCRSLLELG